MTVETAIEHYITSLKKGLLKVMSKMGVSTIRSYKSAQIFEAVGLADEFIEKYFRGTPSRIGGVGVEAIAREVLERHSAAYTRTPEQREAVDSWRRHPLPQLLRGPPPLAAGRRAAAEGGAGERLRHLQAVRRAGMNDEAKSLCTLRGLFASGSGTPVPLDEVEPVETIVKRFVTSAMSLRLHQQGGARDARHRDEPAGRGEQLRGGRRGPGPLRSRFPTGTRPAAPSSRWPPPASA